MYHNLLLKPSFHSLFVCIDDELAESIRSECCPDCTGPLYKADYPRSPLGLPASCRNFYDRRRSFCCGHCRKRITTPSVRFFGRCRFPTAVMVLISAFISSGSRRRYNQVTRYFGIKISLRTWARWRRWWQECFIGTAFWKQAKALLPLTVVDGLCPRQLVQIYSGTLASQLEKALRFLAPLTAGVYRAV